MARPDFDDPRLTAMGLLIEVYEGVTSRLTPVHTSHGISGNDFDTLIRLARSPKSRLRMTDLAVQTSMSTSGVTRVVDRLERHGLVQREPCPGDRRSSFAVLTKQGHDRVRAVLPPLLKEIDACFTGVLGVKQLDALMKALSVVRDTVRPGAVAGGSADNPGGA
ncbi:MAG: MarR family transcriptional regulator [Streptosporangiales bacterium]|nr:MarR family transcriptional regulator [Streptosporangiales bacterium]